MQKLIDDGLVAAKPATLDPETQLKNLPISTLKMIGWGWIGEKEKKRGREVREGKEREGGGRRREGKRREGKRRGREGKRRERERHAHTLRLFLFPKLRSSNHQAGAALANLFRQPKPGMPVLPLCGP